MATSPRKQKPYPQEPAQQRGLNGDVAMDGRYRDAITQASTILADAMLQDADELIHAGRQLDVRVRAVVLRVGLFLIRHLFGVLQERLIGAAKSEGFTVERRPVVEFNTLLGPLEVESVYLYSRERAEGRRPMRDVFGVVGRQYSDALERALTDFGIEKSFGRAAKQFAEHYGWEVGRTTILRLTENLGVQAEAFLEERFKEGEQRYTASDAASPKAELMITGLDGCMIRTGALMTAGEAVLLAENDNERQRYEELPPEKTVRLEKWREVRTGFARRKDQVEALYVCRRGDYETICEQLFGAAGLQGLGFETQVVGLIDGGNGLKEALEFCFAKIQTILDPPHLRQQFYDVAAVLGLEEEDAAEWVSGYFSQLAQGHAVKVIAELESEAAHYTEESPEHERLQQLVKHLTRFVHCVNYREYREKEWPIGSGQAEAAHIFIPQERLKIVGACWKEETLNPMLALRVVRANGWWDEFWESESRRRMAA